MAQRKNVCKKTNTEQATEKRREQQQNQHRY